MKYSKKTKKISAACLVALVGILPMCLTSCGVWDWLWTRDFGEPLESDDIVIGSKDPEEDTHPVFEGAVAYMGPDSAHDGTDIYYLGEEGSPNEYRIIVIDAGHQLEGSSELEPNGPGSDVMKAEVTWGSKGVSTEQNEYDLNLKVALLLRDELIRRGYSVVMIRETNDVQVSNMERALIANKYSADAYVRIHANGSDDETVQGALTICQSENNPYPDCAAHYEQSALLSECILTAFCSQTSRKNLGVREMDNMTGTNWSQVPTTILEMGFLSNPMEDRAMNEAFFRQKAALGIADGLDTYFREMSSPEADTESTSLTEAANE